ncbi:MAG: hypothetical protein R3A50_00090 [Saprospiraceae bacterium]|nr:hypothetical protein [Saprospiraceae bacterium]MCB9345086.1 hypothetical protein [Lewinellaceae bacterium]
MKKLIIALLTMCAVPCFSQHSPCDLDTLFPSDFAQNWQRDSLGIDNSRKEFYITMFTDSKGRKKHLPLNGTTQECLIHYFGNPNKMHLDESTKTFIYYVAVSWISNDHNEYEGITIEFEISNQTQLVTGYYFMIT